MGERWRRVVDGYTRLARWWDRWIYEQGHWWDRPAAFLRRPVVAFGNWRYRLPAGHWRVLRSVALVPNWNLVGRAPHDLSWCQCRTPLESLRPTKPDLKIQLTPYVKWGMRHEKIDTPQGPCYRSEMAPLRPLPSDPGRLDDERLGRLLKAVLPGRPVRIRYVPIDFRLSTLTPAAVAAQAHTLRGMAGVGDLWVHVDPEARVGTQVERIARSDLSGRYSVDVVDVLLPIYAMFCAVRSGSYHELLGRGAWRGWRTVSWRITLHGRVVSGPRSGSPDIVFPGRRPSSGDPVALPRECVSVPELIWMGWNLNKYRGSPRVITGSILRDLLRVWGFRSEQSIVDEVLDTVEALRMGQAIPGGCELTDRAPNELSS